MFTGRAEDGQMAGEQYLTVETSDDKTSCTLRLSMFNIHGTVYPDNIFGDMKFSPDGK